MEVHLFLLQLAAVLLAARIFGELAVRWGMPPVIGELRRRAQEVVLTRLPAAGPGLEPRIDGEPVPVGSPVTLRSDAEGSPTVVAVGSVAFHVIARGDRLFLRSRKALYCVAND